MFSSDGSGTHTRLGYDLPDQTITNTNQSLLHDARTSLLGSSPFSSCSPQQFPRVLAHHFIGFHGLNSIGRFIVDASSASKPNHKGPNKAVFSACNQACCLAAALFSASTRNQRVMGLLPPSRQQLTRTFQNLICASAWIGRHRHEAFSWSSYSEALMLRRYSSRSIIAYEWFLPQTPILYSKLSLV